MPTVARSANVAPRSNTFLPLRDGSRVAVIGGGPAGAFAAYFLLTWARVLGIDLGVDIYEPRDFETPGPAGCNMCGGVVSESLVRAMAQDGIVLPPSVVQREIISYVLCTDEGSVRINMPTREKHIVALHRGAGPSGIAEPRWRGLDAYLLSRARDVGADVIPHRVDGLERQDGRLLVCTRMRRVAYDLVVGATGVNSTAWRLYQRFGLSPSRPQTTRAYITELPMVPEEITRCLGEAMHIFLLRIPRLEFAAIIPKGDVLTVCLLGRDIDQQLIEDLFASRPVQRCLGLRQFGRKGVCRCTPSINVGALPRPYADRFVLVGDCGVTRLYKDGIGAAYRTAKAAAVAALLGGVSAGSFHDYYGPVYRSVEHDNRFGRYLFRGARQFTAVPPLMRGLLSMVAREQALAIGNRPMSHVLWDLFTGSAPYRDIFVRALDRHVLGRFLRESLRSVIRRSPDTAARQPSPLRQQFKPTRSADVPSPGSGTAPGGYAHPLPEWRRRRRLSLRR